MTEAQIFDELSKIQRSVPQELQKQLFKQVLKTPTAEFVVKKALKRKDLDPKKREELEILLRTGEFSKTEPVLDEKIVKKIDKYFNKQLDIAVAQGRLPNKKELTKLLSKKYASKKKDK